MNRNLTRIAMTTAGIMLAHHVAAKAFRDAAFLSAWPATALPLMIFATASLSVALVPVFSRLLGRFSPLAVVSTGFAVSAAGHAVEWIYFDQGRFIVVVIYLHLACVNALLLSGFWSLVAERFDPEGARASYGRISAAGTAGGVFGSFAAERVASMVQLDAVLLLLTALHLLCACGLMVLKQAPVLLPRPDTSESTTPAVRVLFQTPYVSTIAATVVLTSAGSAIIDFLFKSQASASLGSGPNLLRFFAGFYGVLQVLTFIAQTETGTLTHSLGIRRTISTLPAGVGLAGLMALLFQGWPSVIALRGIEAVLHASFFRNGYELLFVPMDPSERQRVKTSLDVTCDRAGEAAGAAVVQAMLVAGVTFARGWLLIVVFVLAALTLWLGRRLDQLYLSVIENQLLKYRSTPPPMSMVSEAGWTIIQLPKDVAAESTVGPSPMARKPSPVPHLDPSMELLVALRSPDPARVSAALANASNLSRMHVAQIVDLLAWDEVMPSVRKTLEPIAPAHLGLLIDALVEPSTDFAIRRRLPRILGTVASARSLDGLVSGLDDARFEVRYHCSRAIDRILTKNPELSVDRARMIGIVERELSVTPQIWRGYRLLDLPDADEPSETEAPDAERTRHLEHIFSLLSTIVARAPLDAAVDGIRSSNAGVRGLAIEYLDQVLPAHVLGRLRALIASIPSSGDAPSQSDEPPAATRSSTRH
jgi:ATP:ADP antiporter, AAA family